MSTTPTWSYNGPGWEPVTKRAFCRRCLSTDDLLGTHIPGDWWPLCRDCLTLMQEAGAGAWSPYWTDEEYK